MSKLLKFALEIEFLPTFRGKVDVIIGLVESLSSGIGLEISKDSELNVTGSLGGFRCEICLALDLMADFLAFINHQVFMES
jgi:hypothetical protein